MGDSGSIFTGKSKFSLVETDSCLIMFAKYKTYLKLCMFSKHLMPIGEKIGILIPTEPIAFIYPWK